MEEVLPELAYEHASTFNWTDLERLNAGKWFLKVCEQALQRLDTLLSCSDRGEGPWPGGRAHAEGRRFNP